MTPGQMLRSLFARTNKITQLVGVVNAYNAILAGSVGFEALYLSGAGVANASLGLPDLGLTNLNDVLEDLRRITRVTSLPILVDVDTGWGGPLNVKRTFSEISRQGAAGAHIEDQTSDKRCGHLEGKRLVSEKEMVMRIESARLGRVYDDFMIIARTDAVTVEGVEKAISRAKGYEEAGADMIFAEAVSTLDDYRRFVDALSVPILANITEFGKTPLFTIQELASCGVKAAIYPLSGFRAMNFAAKRVFETIKNEGSQKSMIPNMQTRQELYKILDYEAQENFISKMSDDLN
ncbi:MAG TPA: methylisocitrate lyase [Gammaproteobacteria bacterium]|nr:methylisocitrate lyase [Gammaproteobacteria bacterium]